MPIRTQAQLVAMIQDLMSTVPSPTSQVKKAMLKCCFRSKCQDLGPMTGDHGHSHGLKPATAAGSRAGALIATLLGIYGTWDRMFKAEGHFNRWSYG